MDTSQVIVLINSNFGEERYLTLEQLQEQQTLDYTQITGENVVQQPRHRVKLLDFKSQNEVQVDRNRFRKKTTPQGLKPYTNSELKDFLKQFGLKVGGKKEELIARLEDRLDETDDIEIDDA